jgi:hypothetical protein
MFVSPVVVLSTLVLLGTGVALLVLGQTDGTVVGLHKASFFVWVGATGIHVLAHVLQLPRVLRARIPGVAGRLGLVAASVAAGALLATVTFPQADRLQDRVTGHLGVDRR